MVPSGSIEANAEPLADTTCSYANIAPVNLLAASWKRSPAFPIASDHKRKRNRRNEKTVIHHDHKSFRAYQNVRAKFHFRHSVNSTIMIVKIFKEHQKWCAKANLSRCSLLSLRRCEASVQRVWRCRSPKHQQATSSPLCS